MSTNEHETKTFGILDMSPNSITEPPVFTEPATLVALHNLKISPEQLIPYNHGGDHSEKSFVSGIEHEMQRFDLIQQVINERNRILDISGRKKKIKIPKNKKKKNPRKKKANKEDMKNEAVETVEADVAATATVDFKAQTLPPLKPSQNPQQLLRKQPAKRKPGNPVSLIDARLNEAAAIKKQKDDVKMANAEKALERVKEVERRQEEMRRQKNEMLRQKAELRMKKLKNLHQQKQDEQELISKRNKLAFEREEKKIAKLKRRKMRQLEREQKWRAKNIYGPQKQQKKTLLSTYQFGNTKNSSDSEPATPNEAVIFIPKLPEKPALIPV